MKKDDPDLHELHLQDDEVDSVVWLRCSGRLPEPNIADFERLNQHLSVCESCRELVGERANEIAMMRQSLAEGSSERRPDCPSDDTWPLVAAGVVSGPEMEEHAADCLHCGPLLRKAVAALHAEPTPEEIDAVQQLEKPGSGFSHALFGTRARILQLPANRKERIRSWPVRNWGFALAACGAIVLAVAYFGYQRQMDDPERLLARVYSAHRTVEWRFRGAPEAPVRQTRGAQANDAEPVSPELLRLRARIAEQVAAHQNDPDWIVASGRLNLLLWRYDAALNDFKRVLELRPEWTAVLSDMAGAHFERGEATGRDSEYGAAIELLSRVLAKQPGDIVALFNRGLAEERVYLFSQAVADWEEALKKEPSGAWANEIRTRLADVKKKSGGR